MTTHELAQLLLNGPNLPTLVKAGVYGLVEVSSIHTNFNTRNKLIPWWSDSGDIQLDQQAIVIE